MPHSVSPERSPSSSDTALPDAPQQSTPSQEAKPVIDHEVDMLSDGQNGEIQTSSPSQEKEQIKLEDLFGDDDEDDEFSSSAPQISKADPDTPEAPTYVLMVARLRIAGSFTDWVVGRLPLRRTTSIPRPCTLSINDSSLSVIYSSGSITRRYCHPTSQTENSQSPSEMMPTSAIKHSLQPTCMLEAPHAARIIQEAHDPQTAQGYPSPQPCTFRDWAGIQHQSPRQKDFA